MAFLSSNLHLDLIFQPAKGETPVYVLY